MKTGATHRLKASVTGEIKTSSMIIADASIEVSDWWKGLPAPVKKQYIEEHPTSKYAEQAIKEGKESGFKASEGNEPGSPTRKKLGDTFRGAKAKIASEMKRTFPMISHATSALGTLAQGKKLDHHEKEVLMELGQVALKAGSAHILGDHMAGVALAKVGVTAVKHAIDHFKHKKGEDDIENFVGQIGDELENSDEAPVPKEHAQPKSAYRTAIAKAIKGTAKHTVAVLEKSFSNLKPATTGLAKLATGKLKDMTPHEKHAMIQCGKFATVVAVFSLPGGLAAHLAAGAGVRATTHAFDKLKSGDFKSLGGRELLGKFVESIGEGLEETLIAHAAEGGDHGGGHEGGGHEGGGGEHAPIGGEVGNYGFGFGDMDHFDGEHGGGEHGESHDTDLLGLSGTPGYNDVSNHEEDHDNDHGHHDQVRDPGPDGKGPVPGHSPRL